MRVQNTAAFVLALSVAMCSQIARGDVPLVSDSLRGSGSLGGSAPALGGNLWTSYAAGNGTPFNASYTTAPGNSSVPAALTPDRTAAGTTFSAGYQNVDAGAFIGFTPVGTGRITATVTITFPAAYDQLLATEATAWGFMGFTTGLANPDVQNGSGQIATYFLIRPVVNGDFDEIQSGVGSQAVGSPFAPFASTSYTFSLSYEPTTGLVNVEVPVPGGGSESFGMTLESGPFTPATDLPINGIILGDRTANTTSSVIGSPAINVSSATFSDLSVTQVVPEPASVALFGLGAFLLLARRRV